MVPTKKVNKTPYELWHGKVPNLSYLKVWGCEAHVRQETSNKLDPRSIKCIFVGYPKDSMGYYFYNPTENKVFVSRHATFLEKEFLLNKASGSNVELEEIQEPQNITPEVGTSYQQIVEEPEQLVAQEPEWMKVSPTNYKDATLDPESKKWNEAMNEEMQSMYDNEVWDLVDLPPDSKAVGSK
ncbi:uncharacterized protein [Rutidosis leptorrhynchoides]|uniref:uncharacterized protein n=1 Tax=Rutidosis leptorrhynchoides TaxID=125765 RepID=UPI003A99508C